MKSGSRQIENVELKKLIPFETNARVHSRKQIDKIVRSIERNGFTNPLLIDENNVLIAGHGRLAAAKQMRLKLLPCIRLDELSEEDKRTYRIADNQLALEAAWNLDLLGEEFNFLTSAGFDLSLTGFDEADVDQILVDFEDRAIISMGSDDHITPSEPSSAAVTDWGDVWMLGNHRLLCGNARNREDVGRLMDGDEADMVFTDAPYNVRIDGHVGGSGKVKHREFAEASGEMTEPQFLQFLLETHGNIASACRDGAIVYSCIDWRHLPTLLDAGMQVFSEMKNLCVWNKTNAGMGTFYRSQHELVTVWKAGCAKHTNNFGLGERGRHRSNVWTYAGVNSFKAGRMEELKSHPTVKPVAMVADAIRDVSHRGQIVLDVFGGSGTTLIAAEKTGRQARLMEIDPHYCDVTIRRWQKQTGKKAHLKETGKSFGDTERFRSARNMENAS